MKKDTLQKLENFKDHGFINLDDMIIALGNYMSAQELKEFVEFIEDEYVKY